MRNRSRGLKGNTNPAAVVCSAPAWGLFNTEAKRLTMELTSRRGTPTRRPRSWEVFPDLDASRLLLVPGPDSDENFEFQWSSDGNRAWINLFEIFSDLDIYILPSKPETLPIYLLEDPELGWTLALQLNERHQSTPEELAEGDVAIEDVAAGRHDDSSSDDRPAEPQA